MKKLLSLALSLCLLVGCSSQPNDQSTSNVKEVGILQLLTHDALDKAREGFIDALKDGGYVEGENLKINYQNPEADQANLSTMADSLIAADPDLILAIATSPVQQLQNINDHTPILATAVTDFVAAGLVDSNENPGGLISGVSDGFPMDTQLDLLLEAVDVKTLGILYTSSEPNSQIQAEQMVAECESRGIKTMVKTVSDKTMIDDTMQSFIGQIDALYVPTDNNIAAAFASVDIVASENKIPVLAGESNVVKNGALLSLGADYYKIGYQTGEMAVEILNGDKKITDFAIQFQKDVDVYYNAKTAAKIGLELPQSIIDKGIDVSK
ncbi:MAG: ABC transporter substrate-binding protein [Erysipelotrichaceae bacterium]|nr:ABC transporter substrate-binding protein [Erysipelotrichaceae bacterium]